MNNEYKREGSNRAKDMEKYALKFQWKSQKRRGQRRSNRLLEEKRTGFSKTAKLICLQMVVVLVITTATIMILLNKIPAEKAIYCT